MEELRKFLASSEFASPLYSWIGSALVLLLTFLPLFRKRRGLALDLTYWGKRVEFKSKRVWVLSALVAIISMLMGTALGNPQTVTKQNVPIYGKPVMVVIDVSRSMEQLKATGEALSRVEKARGIFDDILSRDVEADFGLLLYSTEHYIARYFAFKNELLEDTLENTEEISFVATGTRTAEALAKARRFFSENVEAKDRAILLISDLEGDVQAMEEVAEEMEADLWAGIKVYVIVMGEEQSALDRGPRLTQIKEVKWVGMNDKYGIDQICEEIAAMESSPITEDEILSRKSLVPFLIPPILGLTTLCLVLSETCFRKIP